MTTHKQYLSDQECIATIANGESGDYETIANARLISLAPDLLDAVQAGIAMRQTAIVDDDFPEMLERFDLAAARVIRKLTGER